MQLLISPASSINCSKKFSKERFEATFYYTEDPEATPMEKNLLRKPFMGLELSGAAEQGEEKGSGSAAE